MIAAPAFSASWLLLTSLLESAVRGRLVIVAPAGTTPILILGIWFYLMMVGVIYATQATARAAQTAEQLAGLLRTTLREDRDLVTLADEWAFVRRYLEMEQVRFGDRLAVHADIPADAAQTLVPSVSLLTLVENAVRHGAGPRVEATDVTVSPHCTGAGIARARRVTRASVASGT